MIEQVTVGFVYGLVSPVSYKIRVVGQTTRSLQTRLTEHISHGVNGRYVCQAEIDWITALSEENLRPFIIMLEDCSGKDIDSREQFWISFGLELGWPLLNENRGGRGHSRIPAQTATAQ